MSDITKSNTVILWSGGAEYDLGAAAENIESLIAELEAAREDGAEYVVLSSGNVRGPRWLLVAAETCAIDADD